MIAQLCTELVGFCPATNFQREAPGSPSNQRGTRLERRCATALDLHAQLVSEIITLLGRNTASVGVDVRQLPSKRQAFCCDGPLAHPHEKWEVTSTARNNEEANLRPDL